MTSKQPQNQTQKYDILFSDIKAGRVKIPQFQRDFVWGKDRSAKLLDSLIKGFPIGTFIFWKTCESLRHIRDLGNITLPETPAGEKVAYVLDGQQRLTSLFAVREGVIIKRDGQQIDYKDICIDLSQPIGTEQEVVFTSVPEGKEDCHISVHELLSAEKMSSLFKRYPDYTDAIEFYKPQLTTYDFSTIVIDDYPIDIACEVFTRINTGGRPLTVFEIMVAKTYDHAKDFDLSREYEHLISSPSDKTDLSGVNFETIPGTTVLQCIAAVLIKGKISKNEILKISRDEFISAWPSVKHALFGAVDWLRQNLNIRASRLLPYDALLVPLAYFFHLHGDKPVSKTQDKLLKQYFFWVATSSRFSATLETKIGDDRKKMNEIINETQPHYPSEELKVSPDTILAQRFSTGDAASLAILCLYALQRPQTFTNNAEVQLDNSWLKQSNSKNFHHIFPRAFLKKQGYEAHQINVALNIAFVDEYVNKYKIKAKAPSIYIKEFQDENESLQEALDSHLISISAESGILEDDYQAFLKARAQSVSNALNDLLNP